MFAATSALKSSSSVNMIRTVSNNAATARSRTPLLQRGPSTMSRSPSRMSHRGSATPTINMFVNLTLDMQGSAATPSLWTSTLAQRRGLTSLSHTQTAETMVLPEPSFAQAAVQNSATQAAEFTLPTVVPRRPSLTQTISSSMQNVVNSAANATNRIKLRQVARKVITVVRFSEFPKRELKIIETTEVETLLSPATPKATPLKSCRDRPPTPYPDHSLGYFA